MEFEFNGLNQEDSIRFAIDYFKRKHNDYKKLEREGCPDYLRCGINCMMIANCLVTLGEADKARVWMGEGEYCLKQVEGEIKP